MTTTHKPEGSNLPEGEWNALLKLLGDEDPDVFAAVREKIIACGPSVCDWLRPQTLSSDPQTRRHAQSIIHHFESRDADREFLAFCLRHGEKLNLEVGTLKLAQTAYPEINTEAYSAVLDEFADAIRLRLNTDVEPREQLSVINDHLFLELGFRGNEEHYFDPRNNYLNQVLDRRTGNPIGLSLVYLLLAQRLKLPIVGIGLPGHFVCRYQSCAGPIYIDAFNRGHLLTKADVVQYLIHSAFGLHEQFLAPMTPRRMLMRLCGNLHQSYLHLENKADAARLQGYLVALSRQNAH